MSATRSDAQIIENFPIGYARHRLVTDEQNKAIDYVFLQVNATFESMTGLDRDKIIGRRATHVLPGLNEGDFDWVQAYSRVANGTVCIYLEPFSKLTRFLTKQGICGEHLVLPLIYPS